MQEDHGSLMPGRMTWSHSVKPPKILNPGNDDQIKSKWRMAFTGAVSAALYIYLSKALLDENYFWIASCIIILFYVALLMGIWWKQGKNVRNAIVFIFSSMVFGALLFRWFFL